MNKQEQLKENVIKCCIEGKMTVSKIFVPNATTFF